MNFHAFCKEDSLAFYRHILACPTDFPLRFTYRGEVREGLGGLPLLQHLKAGQTGCEKEELLFRLDENVVIRLKTAFWTEFGAFEWTVFFSNTGDRDSAVLSDIRAVDMTFTGDDPVLKGIYGDHEKLYEPYVKPLADGNVHFCSDSGRPTHVWFPYFNLAYGAGGALLALGWAGTWQADFTAVDAGAHFTAVSTNGFSAYLKPGETVRTALMAFLPYEGRDEDAATNLWRRWYRECNLPKADAQGHALEPFSTCFLANDTGRPNSDGSISEGADTWRPSLEKILAEGLHPDFRWFDAGWYSDPRGGSVPELWWHTIGSWELDGTKWPGNSFLDSTDFARAHGMKTLVWFEPERVTDAPSLAKNYGYDTAWALRMDAFDETWQNTAHGIYTNNLGDPACLAWTTERIVKFLREQRVELYREDNNSDSAAAWRKGDAAEGKNRTGITENKAVMGHYALWDAIIAYEAQAGGCTFVDSCASGGGRNDLESMRRGIPLLRSDNDRTSTALRLSMTTSFNRWLPFCGASTVEKKEQLDGEGVRDKYVWRASYLPCLHLSAPWTKNPDVDYDDLRFGCREWNTVKGYLLADLHVLTPWHAEQDKKGWTAFSLFDPKKEEGVLQAFRMEDCAEGSCTVRLTFLLPDARYTLRDADTGAEETLSGRALADGISLHAASPRTALLYYIRRA